MAKPEPTSNAIPHLTNEPLFSHGDTKNMEMQRCAKCTKTAPWSPLHDIPCVSVLFFYAPPSRCVRMVLLAQRHLLLNSQGSCTLSNVSHLIIFVFAPFCFLYINIFVSALFHVIWNVIPCHPDHCSMSSGPLFHIIRNNTGIAKIEWRSLTV